MKLTLQIIGLGLLNGSRTLAVPALLSSHLAQGTTRRPHSPLSLLARPLTARLLRILAVGELIGDKIPGIPDRIEPPGLIGRGSMGALVGAALCDLYGKPRLLGALVGGGAAVVGAFIGFDWRIRVTREGGPLPDPFAALIEDTVVVGGGILLANLTPKLDS